MSNPFIRRGAVVSAGVAVFAGIAAAPIAAFADTPASPSLDAVPAAFPAGSVTASVDPDGAGTLFTLNQNVQVDQSIQMPADATLNGDGHTITAVEDATSPSFPGAVIASTPGDGSSTVGHLDVRNLHITTQHFTGSNSGGALAGIAMYRTSGTISHVTVNGISHDNGVQEGWGIAVRNSVNPLDSVQKNDINVPRAQVSIDHVRVTNYQKAGLLLDGNLSFTADHVRIGQGGGPNGEANLGIAANALQISRGASGTVSHASVATNSIYDKGGPNDTPGTGVLLYNAKNVGFDHVRVTGGVDAELGLAVSNDSNTIDTAFTMHGGSVISSAVPADGTGVEVDGASAATLIGTKISGWATSTNGAVTQLTPTSVAGFYHLSRPTAHRVRVDVHADKLAAGQVEAKALNWVVKVDGHRAARIHQHAGDNDVWAQGFRNGTGTHTVQVIKNGVSQRTVKVHTS